MFENFVKTEEFKNIIENFSLNTGLDIAFVAFYGSRNYNLETDKSDYDFYIVYYPPFENFFRGEFLRFSVIQDTYDYFATPIHEYIFHAMKGNIKFMEPFICGTIFSTSPTAAGVPGDHLTNKAASETHGYVWLSNFFEDLKKYLAINYDKNFKTQIGIVSGKKINIIKDNYTSNTLKYKDSYGYDIKEAINALRILFLLENYLKTGKYNFIVKNNPVYAEFEKYMTEINSGRLSKKQCIEIIDEKILSASNLYNKSYSKEKKTATSSSAAHFSAAQSNTKAYLLRDSAAQLTKAASAESLSIEIEDRSSPTLREVLEKKIKLECMNICLDNICSTRQDSGAYRHAPHN